MFDFIKAAASAFAAKVAQLTAKLFGRAAQRVVAETIVNSEETYVEDQAKVMVDTCILTLKHITLEVCKVPPVLKTVLWLQSALPIPVLSVISTFVSTFLNELEVQLFNVVRDIAVQVRWRQMSREGGIA